MMKLHARAVTTLWMSATLLIAVPAAKADVVVLAPTKDATLISEDDRKANGSGSHIFAGNIDNGGQRRAVLEFDIAGSIPAGATINSVTLQLYVNRSVKAGNRNVELRQVLTPWTEGPSNPGGQEGDGDSAQLDDVTWRYTSYDPNNESTAPQWTNLGGDISGTQSAVTNVGASGTTPTWSSAGMVADVQTWLDSPSTNYGWLLKDISTGGSGTAKRYGSRQNNKAAERPQLTIDFSTTQLTGACCETDGSGSCSVAVSGTCTGSYEGDDSVCTPNPCDTGCCLPNAQAQCIETDAATCTAQGGTVQGAACSAVQCPVVLTPYVDALPLPAVATPTAGSAGGAASYHMAMRETQQQLHSELAGPTTIWGYDDGSGATFPGPTIEASVGKPIDVTWENDLRDAQGLLRTDHYLTVDLCPHGAAQNADARAVVHLHGGHLAAEFDGYPEDTFPPGQQVVYQYPNWQLPGTLWYHDHALGITRLNVYMGLAGLWLIRDEFEQSLGLPAGEFEVPLAIQDRSFNPDGSFYYPPEWRETFFGEHVLVNGKVWPYHQVKQGKYRFRLLSGSGSRTYRLSLSTGADINVIGMEGGLLTAPATVTEVTLGPGERADVVVDFAPYPSGTEVLLVNDAPTPFPGSPGVGVVPEVMKFIVSDSLPGAPPHTAALPATLRPMEVLQEADATVHRKFHLEKGPGTCTPDEWEIKTIDATGAVIGSKWVDITEIPELGETEVWKFVNLSGMTHPMHVHLVMFQVLDRQSCMETTGDCIPIGSPVPPPPHERGWKDTVQVGPDEIVRVIARFEDYEGLFSYHCHILEHEDHEMMRQFQSVATIPHCSDGLDNDGDGLTDFAGGDPGCESPSDPGERAATLVCDDGLDNDGDAATDHPADPICLRPSWPIETVPEPSLTLGLAAGIAFLGAASRRRARSSSRRRT